MIGILPCAGTAERFMNLPKYLLPCPGGYLLKCHVDAMDIAGCENVLIGKSNNGALLKQYSPNTFNYYPKNHATMTQTVIASHKYPMVYKSHSVLFGMPDTYFEFRDVYRNLASTLDHCDIAVAVFKARPGQHTQGGMVSFSHNIVTEVVDKPAETSLQYIWGALAWKPAFWNCLTPDMPHVGYGLPVAIERGLIVRAVVCEGGFWDCGTPERYFEMIRMITGKS